MQKQEFLDALAAELAVLSADDAAERLAFYGEIIDDLVEEGHSEAEAVASVGTPKRIMEEILAETPLLTLAKQRIKPGRRLAVWEQVLLWVGSPLWLSLAVSLFAVILSLYASLWSVIVSLWASLGAIVAGGLGVVALGFILVLFRGETVGLALLGAALACGGLAILMFFGCRWLTVGTVRVSKRALLGIKKRLVRKEKEHE